MSLRTQSGVKQPSNHVAANEVELPGTGGIPLSVLVTGGLAPLTGSGLILGSRRRIAIS